MEKTCSNRFFFVGIVECSVTLLEKDIIIPEKHAIFLLNNSFTEERMDFFIKWAIPSRSSFILKIAIFSRLVITVAEDNGMVAWPTQIKLLIFAHNGIPIWFCPFLSFTQFPIFPYYTSLSDCSEYVREFISLALYKKIFISVSWIHLILSFAIHTKESYGVFQLTDQTHPSVKNERQILLLSSSIQKVSRGVGVPTFYLHNFFPLLNLQHFYHFYFLPCFVETHHFQRIQQKGDNFCTWWVALPWVSQSMCIGSEMLQIARVGILPACLPVYEHYQKWNNFISFIYVRSYAWVNHYVCVKAFMHLNVCMSSMCYS